MLVRYFSLVILPSYLLLVPPVFAKNMDGVSFASIPPDYVELQAASLISGAKASPPDYYVNKTNGYKVTAPSGAEFVVDSITQPKCAFYATYVSTDENGYLNAGTGNNPAVVSNVYVGEVNFDKCQ